jgi:WD40 repeat protein
MIGRKGKPMRRQSFAAFALLAATLSITVPLASASSAEKVLIRTDQYGDPLPKGAIMRLGTARFAQPFPFRLAFSPDGQFLVSAGNDKRIRLWDPSTGRELRALEGHTSPVNCIAESADGKWLASGSQNHELFLWEIDTGKIRQQFRGHNAPITCLALSPNGKILASSCYGWTLRLWDTESGKEILSLPVDRGYHVNAMTFAPDSQLFAYSDRYSRGIQLVDVATGKVRHEFKGHRNHVSGLAFTADGATLFSGSLDRTIRAWDVASGKERRRYGDEKQAVHCLALAPDRKTLAYVAAKLVHFTDLATNEDRVPPWDASPLGVLSIAYSADSKKVAVGGNGIAVLDTATGKPLNPLPENVSHIHRMEYAADSKVLAVWRWWEDMTIELWDTVKGRKMAMLRPKSGRFASMVFSPNGKYLTTGEGNFIQGKYQGIICLWDVQTGKRHKEFPQMEGWIDLLSYSADGKTLGYLQMGPQGDAFVFWDAEMGKERGRIQPSKRPGERNLRPSPDGRFLAWGSRKKAVDLWDTKIGKLLRSFGERSTGSPVPPAFSPDGRMIATPGGKDMDSRKQIIQPDIVLWETATGKERLHIAPNDGQLTQLAFSPDGRLLASVGLWETIRVWDTWTGKEVGRFMGHRGRINTFAFAPDGKSLASGGSDNTILIWDVSGLLPASKPAEEKLSREQLARFWDDLLGTDAVRAYAAITELARHPGQTEGLFNGKLTAYTVMNPERLARLIPQLDSDDFKTRENASKELANLGRLAEGALSRALDREPSAELKNRIQDLLDKLDSKEDNPEQWRLLRAIEVLERLGTPEARRLLRKLDKEASDPNAAREAQASMERLGEKGKDAP